MRKLSIVRNGILISIVAASVALAQEPAQQNNQDLSNQAPNSQAQPNMNANPNANPNAISNDGWRRLGAAPSMQQNGAPGFSQNGPMPQGAYQGGQPQAYPPPPPMPAQLSLQPGTFLVVRMNQALSTDHNQQGDAFSATLVKPLVVDGVVVADRGQTIEGRVSDAQKAGRVSGTSRLGVEMTELTLVDGQQMPLHTQLVSRSGGTSVGRDAGAIGTTTAVGAIAGAAADGGAGAGIGAGAGAAAGIIGVLLTRGKPSVIYPETVLTFRIENPIMISTTRAPQAFRFVGPGDYDQPQDRSRAQVARPAPRYYGPGYGAGYGVYGPGYYGYPYPYYYGPSIGIRFGGYGRHWR